MCQIIARWTSNCDNESGGDMWNTVGLSVTKQSGLYVSWHHGIEFVSPGELMLWIMLQDNEASGWVSLCFSYTLYLYKGSGKVVNY